MKIADLKTFVASALLLMTASVRALQPEVLYTFQLGARGPRTSLVEGSDGNFYGTTEGGAFEGAGGYSVRKRYPGTVFRVTTNGVLTVVNSFRYGQGPNGLVIGRDGHFYSTTEYGGSSGYGTVSQVTTNGVLTTLVSFGATNGLASNAGLVLGSDGSFYGTTKQGGSGYVDGSNARYGTVFRVTTNGVLASLTSFTGTNGSHPNELVLGRHGDLYGTTERGGTSNLGTVFRVTTSGVLTSLASFTGSNGASPKGRLVVGNDGDLYGTTAGGGSSTAGGSGYGTVFKVTTNGVLTSLVSFTYDNGRDPLAGLVLGSDGVFYGTTFLGGSNDAGTVFKVTANGVLTTLVSFNNANGASPQAALVLGSDGNLYGTTSGGGSSGGGTVFKVTPSTVLTLLVSFASADGAYPEAGLTLGSDGHFYGTTTLGGAGGVGTVFQMTSKRVFTTLVSFNLTNGAKPKAGMVLGNDGAFYGTTSYGGSNHDGTVFRVTTNGELTSLVSFTNGERPEAGLVLGDDGDFYGTTYTGGSGMGGTVFRVTTNGVLTTLVSFTFTGQNGRYPSAGLVLGRDGHLYGTTTGGGSSYVDGNNPGYGTVFRVTSDGVFTSLASFTGSNGAYPDAALVLGRDGDFYGTTFGGNVFRMTTNGLLTSLVSFTRDNGAYPDAALVLGNDGHFYGTTLYGGTSDHGTVFKVTTNGVLTMLSSLTGPDAVFSVYANELVLGNDGHLYGTTSEGGSGGGGTIFRLVISVFTSVARQPCGSMLLTGTGPRNGGYRLWASTDLSLPFASWTLLTSASFDSNGNFSYTDVGATAHASRFYELSVP